VHQSIMPRRLFLLLEQHRLLLCCLLTKRESTVERWMVFLQIIL
jgi:hypothetical protein